MVENVLGFQSDFRVSIPGRITNFADALNEKLSLHYHTSHSVLKAEEYGVPQHRRRFFLVGFQKSESSHRAATDFFLTLAAKSQEVLGTLGLSRVHTARDAISDLEVGYAGKRAHQQDPSFEELSYLDPRSPLQVYLRDGYQGVPPDTRLARHSPEVVARFRKIIKASHEEGRLTSTLSRETRRTLGIKKMAIRVLDPLGTAPTITSLPDDLLHYSEPRTLTVRETARLQTFPDWFAFKGKYTTGGHLRRIQVPRFTQVANAIPPLLAQQLGQTLRVFSG